MAAFEPHGDTDIEVKGRLLWLRPHGHLNAEEVRRILQRIDEIVPAFGGKPWAVLYILESAALLTPDAESSATLASPQLIDAGMAALAIVQKGSTAASLQETQVRSIYSHTECPIKVFGNEADAEQWISALIGGIR